MLKSDEKRKGAIALGYDKDQNSAPQVVAKGFGKQAERILEVAEENKIFVKEDPGLFEALARLEPGEEIPVKLYMVIAELLAYVYKVNGTVKEKVY